MKTILSTNKNKALTYMVVCALSLTTFSCSKDDNPAPKNEEYAAKVMLKDGETKNYITASTAKGTTGSVSRKGDLYSIKDFRQGTLNSAGTALETANTVFYFNFKENDGADATTAQVTLNATQRNMDIIPNTKDGYKLSYINQAFNDVKATDQFTELEKAGVSFGTGIGWANYDVTVHHVVAAPNRTFVLTKDGKPVFKFRVISVYSGGMPNAARESTNYVFYSIDYQEFK